MPTPLQFECEKCGYHHHENTPPKGYTPDAANVWVKNRYYGD